MKNLKGLSHDSTDLSGCEWIIYGQVDSRTRRLLRSDSVEELAEELMGQARSPRIEVNELEPGVRLVVVNQSLSERMLDIIKERVLPVYLDILTHELPALRDAFENTQAHHTQGYRWEDIHQWIICGLLMDWGVGQLLYGADQRATSEIWCIQGKGEAKNRFGLRRHRHADLDLGLWEFWHHRIQRLPVVVDTPALELLYHIWSRRGVLPTSVTATVQGQKSLLLLTYHELIAKDERVYSLCLPVFPNEDYVSLCHQFERTSLHLVTRAITPILSELLKDLAFEDKVPLRIFNRFLMEQVADEAILQDLLSPFPTTPPPSWGRWICMECKG